jgi:hypothetical protein
METVSRNMFNQEMSAKTEENSPAPALAWFVLEDRGGVRRRRVRPTA